MTLITPDGVLSHPHLFSPQMPPNPRPGQKARYQTVLLFPIDMPPDQQAMLLEMKKAALAALKEKWGERVEQMLKDGSLRWPFVKKWTNKRGEPKYDPEKWSCYINPWSEQPPGIVSRFRGSDGKPAKLTDQSEIYPGVLARLSVNLFVYEAQGNWGVNFGLQNVQKRGDGPRLDNRLSAQDTFDGEDAPEADMPAPGEAGTPATAPGEPKIGTAMADLFR